MSKKSYRPRYHAHVRSGWCNDPNGMIFYHGRAHLFFQHYPYKAEWGTMHWGHFSTEDFVHWREEELALKPDEMYEEICGCCSGNAVEKNGKLWLMYTAAQPDRQRQCLAFSEDGVHFTKVESNPILTAEMLDEEIAGRDFRDPKVFMRDGKYYCLAGTRIIDPDNPMYITSDGYLIKNIGGYNERNLIHGSHAKLISGAEAESISSGAIESGEYLASGYGNMILFTSEDLIHWSYCGKLLYRQKGFAEYFFTLDGVYECPDYLRFGESDIVIASPQNLPRIGHEYENLHSTLYFEGRMDMENGAFAINSVHEIDAGFDFYAPQCWHTPDGRIVMLAWKEMWDRSYPSREEGWAGTYTLPRELSFKDGRLYQTPVREIDEYLGEPVMEEDMELSDYTLFPGEFYGDCLKLEVEIAPGSAKKVGVKLFCGGSHETLIYYDSDLKSIVFDRTHSGIEITGRDETLTVRHCDIDRTEHISLTIFLDVSSVEVFINGGRYCMSGNVYPDGGDDRIGFFAAGGGTANIMKATKYDINV